MARPQSKKTTRQQSEHRVRVTNLAHGGDGVARDEQGRVLFIPGVLPGEEVHVVEVKGKKSFAHARLLSVMEPAPERVESPCQFYDRCGGCDLLHASFDAQLPLKAQASWETLHRISGVTAWPEEGITMYSSSRQGAWRVRATIRARRIGGEMCVGMLERGSHRIVPMTPCMMLVEPLQEVMALVREVLSGAEGITEAECFLELATPSGEVVVTVDVLRGEGVGQAEQTLLDELTHHARVRGVRLRLEDRPPKDAGVVTVKAQVVMGICPGKMREEELPAGMFRQAHAELSGELVKHVLAQIKVTGQERVLELFSGCGNFTFAMCEDGITRVHAMEVSRPAVQVGEQLVGKHGLQDVVSFSAVDLFQEGWSKELDETWPLVLLDPPRNGAKLVCEGLATMAHVRDVVYVACDPGSLARDIGVLCAGGFEVKDVAMFDMFPGTAHVETVVRFSRKG